jgi:hypothetical protein
MSEARAKIRLNRLEADIGEIRVRLTAFKEIVVRIDERLSHLASATDIARIEAPLPYLATRADLAEKPGKGYLCLVIGTLIVAYAAGLAGLATLPVLTKLMP